MRRALLRFLFMFIIISQASLISYSTASASITRSSSTSSSMKLKVGFEGILQHAIIICWHPRFKCNQRTNQLFNLHLACVFEIFYGYNNHFKFLWQTSKDFLDHSLVWEVLSILSQLINNTDDLSHKSIQILEISSQILRLDILYFCYTMITRFKSAPCPCLLWIFCIWYFWKYHFI